MRSRVGAASLAVVLLGGCLSQSSGYGRVTRLTRERVGVGVRASSEPTTDADADAAILEILRSPLDADAAARVALLASPEVRAAMADVGEARARFVSEMALPNPMFQATVRFRDGGDTDLDLFAGINVRQLVLVPFTDAPASADVEAAATSTAAIAIGVAYDARGAWYELVAANEIAALSERLTVAASASSSLSGALAEAGNIPALQALNERALYEDARGMLATANVEAANAREKLNAELGLFGERGASWTAPNELPRPPRGAIDTADLEAAAVGSSLEVQAWRLRERSASLHEDLARARGWLPDINAGVVGEREHDGWGIGPQVGVTLPLFYQGQGEADAYEAEGERAKQMAEAFAIRVRAAARSSAQRLAVTEQRVAWFEDTVLPLRKRIVAETLLHYNAMSVSAFQLLSARRDEIASQRAYVEALLAYWRARISVESLRAGRLPG